MQDQLAVKARRHRSKVGAAKPSLLTGMLSDAQGNRFTPSHAVRSGRRYRYYVSAAPITETGEDRAPVWRLAAQEVEGAVIRILVEALTSPAGLLEGYGAGGMPVDQMRKMLARAARLAAALSGSPQDRAKLVRGLVEKMIVDEKAITIKMRPGALSGRDGPSPALEDPSSSAIELTAAVALKRRGVETKLTLPRLDQQNHSARRDPALIKAIARGRAWFDELATGRAPSLQALANRDGITRRYIPPACWSHLPEPRAGRRDLAGPATRRAHRDASDRTRSAVGLDRAAQIARKLSRTTRRYAAARGPHRGRRVVATGLSFPELGLHQCPSEKKGQTESGHSQLVPFSRPEPGTDGATAATLAASVRGTPLRQTQWRREADSNRRSLSYDQYPNGLKKAPELCAQGQPRFVRTREMCGRSRYPDNPMVRRGPMSCPNALPKPYAPRVRLVGRRLCSIAL